MALDYDIFSTDGQFPNQDIDRYTGYFQIKQALTPHDSVYLNLKFEDIDRGDSSTLYDPSTRDPDLRVQQEQAPVTIIGYQHEWSPASRTLMLGGLLQKESRRESEAHPPSSCWWIQPTPSSTNPVQFGADSPSVRDTEIYFGEIQQIWSDEQQTFLSARASTPAVSRPPTPSPTKPSQHPARRSVTLIHGSRLRSLGRLRLLHPGTVNGLWATAGLAYDWQEYPRNSSIPPATDDLEKSIEFLPKAGLVWTPNADLTFRLGYARSVGGATFDESVRLEPTQVAGFLQSFRTLVDGSEVGGLASPLFETGGASVLYKFPTRTYVGAEAFFRTAKANVASASFPWTPSPSSPTTRFC